jgi:hypothetical protein
MRDLHTVSFTTGQRFIKLVALGGCYSVLMCNGALPCYAVFNIITVLVVNMRPVNTGCYCPAQGSDLHLRDNNCDYPSRWLHILSIAHFFFKLAFPTH